MYTLFYSPGACSLAVHTVLIEMNAEFELVDTAIAAGKNRSPEFLKLNPKGQVPVLVDEGKPLTEGGAILLYLLEKHRSDLLPTSGWERAKALEWLMFCNSTLHPTYSRAFFLMRTVKDKEVLAELGGITCKAIQNLWDAVEANLVDKPYLVGEQCTIADILLAVIANWTPRMPASITFGSRTTDLLRRVVARPAYQQALQAEKVEYVAVKQAA